MSWLPSFCLTRLPRRKWLPAVVDENPSKRHGDSNSVAKVKYDDADPANPDSTYQYFDIHGKNGIVIKLVKDPTK